MQSLFQKIGKIVSPLVVGLFDTNISQFAYLMGGPWSQLDPYTPPNDNQVFYTSHKPSQQTQPGFMFSGLPRFSRRRAYGPSPKC